MRSIFRTCPRFTRLMSLTLVLGLAGCSIPGWTGLAGSTEDSSKAQEQPQASGEPVSPSTLNALNVYLARASHDSVDFEQYRIEQGVFFYECGLVRAGRQFPREQQALELSAPQSVQLQEASQKLAAILPSNELKLDQLGSLVHLADPGQVIVSIGLGSREIKATSSVDELVNNSGRRGRALRELVRLVRRQAGTPRCGNHDFYGIQP
jgi:hypothetical protein